jgi:hypothetical protein
MSLTEWISATIKGDSPDSPEPGEIEASMRGTNKLHPYTELADRMSRVVHGKSRYSEKAAKTLFGSLVSPSEEAFTMRLYK